MEETYLNVKNFLSSKTMVVPDCIDEFLKLYNKAAPEMVFRVEKLINPMFQDYTLTFSEETDRLRQYTYLYDKDTDKKVNGIFVFQFKDMHIAYPDRFFITIEDMIDGKKFNIDHGKVYYSFREGNTSDIESFISFKELGYNNIHDYETSGKMNTSEYYSKIKKLADTLPQNIKDKFFNINQSYINDKILREADLFYYKQKSGNPSYEEIIESFELGYDDFVTFNTAKIYGNLTYNDFSEFRKYADSFNTYEAYLKAKKNSIWSESGVLLFEKLEVIKEKSDYPNMVEALIHYILENYIFEKMSKEAFTNKLRNIINDIVNKYGMQDNRFFNDYNSLLESSIADLENRKVLFEYSQSTGVIRIIK
ncbi:MAG TPA: hypothetical protein PK514_15470 [Spirochaetota bacterium]|nr:hypothetical protein [Spirochaetota bacterium]